MTYEEALEYAKSYLTVKGVPIRSTGATKCIVEALEKQIPKKPRFCNKSRYHRCPVCEAPTVSDYCSFCGQALDWEGN